MQHNLQLLKAWHMLSIVLLILGHQVHIVHT